MIPHYNFLRKPPADFGWDWGPALAPAGIHGGVLLIAYSTAYITGVAMSSQCVVPLTNHGMYTSCDEGEFGMCYHAVEPWVVMSDRITGMSISTGPSVVQLTVHDSMMVSARASDGAWYHSRAVSSCYKAFHKAMYKAVYCSIFHHQSCARTGPCRCQCATAPS